MTRDRESNVWVAAGARGLLRVDPDGSVQAASEAGSSPRTRHGDRSRIATATSGSGPIAASSAGAIPCSRRYSRPQGLPSDASGPIHAAADGRIWFGPSSGGLYWIRDGQVHQVTEAGLPDDVVYSITAARGEVWVGRQRGGVTRAARRRRRRITAERFTQRDGLAQDSVYAVHRTRDGSVWAGTLSGGASRFARTAVRDLRHRQRAGVEHRGLDARGARRHDVVRRRRTASARCRRGGWRTYTTADGLPSNDVNTLFEDRAGTLWVGTADGLALVQGGAVTSARDQRAGAAAARSSASRTMAAAGSGSDATDEILRVNREALAGSALQPGDVRRYGIADGLLGVEAVKRHRSVVQDAQRAHLVRADARAVDGRSGARRRPRAAGADARRAIDRRRRIGRPARSDSPAVQPPPDRARLRRPEPGGARARPVPLPARRLRSRLERARRRAPGGLHQPGARALSVPRHRVQQRRPLERRRGVARASRSSRCSGRRRGSSCRPWRARRLAGWGLYRLRVRQVARRLNVRFEERLAERTRIAQELHDTLLQGFVSASMQLHVAVDRLPADSPARPSLGRVLDLMRRVIEEGRNAVRGLRSSTHRAARSRAGVRRRPAGARRSAAADYRVIVEGRPRPLQADDPRRGLPDRPRGAGQRLPAFRRDARRGRARVRRQASCACSCATTAAASIRRSCAAAATGIGASPGMRERAERIGATLKVRSRADAGTEVELRVPGRVAFERQSSGWLPWRHAAAADRATSPTSQTSTEKHP